MESKKCHGLSYSQSRNGDTGIENRQNKHVDTKGEGGVG